ncbi:MAG: hypothetical protein QOH83_2661 [Solirubrobacteraceae bacterium]|nr:hypothetical protein [Solirubrobacteraceae bacterium]
MTGHVLQSISAYGTYVWSYPYDDCAQYLD